jgi:hypothetical protein
MKTLSLLLAGAALIGGGLPATAQTSRPAATVGQSAPMAVSRPLTAEACVAAGGKVVTMNGIAGCETPAAKTGLGAGKATFKEFTVTR